MLRTQGITRALARTAFQAKQKSPHLFFGAGMVGVVTGGVLACKATLQLEDTIDDFKDDLEKIKEGRETPGTKLEALHDNEYRGVVARVYANNSIKLVRLYGPAIVVTGIGIACLTGSHIQLTRRNAALQATLIAVQTAYDEYRSRVKEEIGEDRENAIYRNLDGIAEGDADENRDPNRFSVYARVFDDTNPNWEHTPEENRIFIQCQQNYANHLLTARGYIFLNEVYDVLGYEHSRAGQFVGWIMNGKGDNYIDFGVFETRNNSFVNGEERSVWLDFNVDGVIIDKI